MDRGIIHRFVWLRIIGDTIFTAGLLSLGWFALWLKTGWSLRDDRVSHLGDKGTSAKK